MTKTTRWVLFYVSIAIFLIASYLVVVYALGYQYDFQSRSFVRNGSFRVVANTSADVTVNGKRAGSLSFLSNTFSKSNVLPRTYTVELKKEHYYSWKKRVAVEAGKFTDIPQIVLVPDYSIDKDVLEAFASPSHAVTRKLKGKVAEFDGRNLWVTWLEDTSYQPFHTAGDRELILKAAAPITQIEWYPDNNHIVFLSGGSLWFTEIDTRGGVNTYKLTPWPLPLSVETPR